MALHGRGGLTPLRLYLHPRKPPPRQYPRPAYTLCVLIEHDVIMALSASAALSAVQVGPAPLLGYD